jgi:phosphoglycolate phosphatase
MKEDGMGKRGIIFDLDGTLTDTIEDIADHMNTLLKEYGFGTYGANEYKQMVGNGLRNLVLLSVPDGYRKDPLVDEMTEKLVTLYAADPVGKTSLYPGMKELLSELQSREVPMSVLSNKSHEIVSKVADTLLKPWRFHSVRGSGPEFPRKPDPKSAFASAHTMGLSPEEILFVGDSGVDMQTGRNAGMTPLGVLWGFRDKKELEENGAAGTIRAPSELFRYLDS